MRKASRNKKLKRKRKPFLKPYKWPEGMQPGDLVAIDKDGNVYPICPEIVGKSWEEIRAFLAPLDRSHILSLDDIRRMDDTEQ